jgi:hypothetical protein
MKADAARHTRAHTKNEPQASAHLHDAALLVYQALCFIQLQPQRIKVH